MNIHFHYPKGTRPAQGRACPLPAAPSPVPAGKRDGVDDADGPGAGGGYDTYDGSPRDADGPGAGGGYDSVDPVPADADGPGAGGGYDGVPNGDGPGDADGPGAGGGYDSVFWKSFPPATAGSTAAYWETPMPFATNGYFVAGGQQVLASTKAFVPPWLINNANIDTAHVTSFTINGAEIVGKKKTQ